MSISPVKCLLSALLSLVCAQPGTAQEAAPPLTALVFSPDQRQLLCGSQAGLEIRSQLNFSQSNLIKLPIANVHDIEFSPDGRQIAIAGGNPGEAGSVAIYNWPEMDHVVTLDLNQDSIYDVCWAADSRILASASLDHTVVIADTATAEIKHHLQGHSKGATAVQFIDEHTLASAGIDQSIRIWNIDTEEIVRTLNNHTQMIHAIRLCPESEGLPVLVSISGDRSVRFWQPTIGRMVRFARLNEIPVAVRWHPSEMYVVVVTESGQLYEVDYRTAEVRWRMTANAPRFGDQKFEKWCHAFAVDFEKSTVIFAGARGAMVFGGVKFD